MKLSDIPNLLPEKKKETIWGRHDLDEENLGFNKAIDLMDKTADVDRLADILSDLFYEIGQHSTSHFREWIASKIISNMGEWIR